MRIKRAFKVNKEYFSSFLRVLNCQKCLRPESARLLKPSFRKAVKFAQHLKVSASKSDSTTNISLHLISDQ